MPSVRPDLTSSRDAPCTPLTKESMAELLELHRAGQQVDREAEASAQRDIMRAMIETQVQDAVKRLAADLPERIGQSIASQLSDNKRVRRSFMWLVSNGTVAGVLAALLLFSIIAAVVSATTTDREWNYWTWRALHPSVNDGDAQDQAMKRRLWGY